MRLIDADALIKHLEEEVNECGDYDIDKPVIYGTMLGLKSGISFAQAMPTVDIKTEVAREIFAEIYKTTSSVYNEYVRTTRGIGAMDYAFVIKLDHAITELKNKYTKEGVGV